MKKFTIILISLLILAALFSPQQTSAQAPDKMSYQAVIRDAGDDLVTNQSVGIQISILQGAASGTAVYVETQTPTTNASGLVSIEIGAGTVVNGDFSTIDWANGPYFIKTETDPTGGTNYTITGTSQLLSVPYALHAKTAENLSGEIAETDPVFTESAAANIVETDIAGWNDKLDEYTETDPVFENSVAGGITEEDLTNWNNADFTETDPVFENSAAGAITDTDLVNWNNKLDSYTETDPAFTEWDKSTDISITESQVSDLGAYIETETDPAVSANFDFTDAANGDLLQFNGTKWVKVTPGYISGYTVTESDVIAHEAAITLTESQISDLGAYIETETDPAFITNFDFTGVSEDDLLRFDGTKWVKFTPGYISDYTVTESDVTAHQGALEITESQISDLGAYIETETDPSVPAGTQTGEMQYWDGSSWLTVAAGIEDQVLTVSNGVPTWKYTWPSDENTTIVDVTSTTGKVWMDRNLGASQVATSSTDADAYGDSYQWGRGTDGHEKRNSGTTPTVSATDTPEHGDFITVGISPFDWRNPQNDDLWQGVSGANNPCPSGYRLPTEAEWNAEMSSWSTTDAAGAIASPLKLPLAGFRIGSGSLLSAGSGGYYWSSTVSVTFSEYLFFSSSNIEMDSERRTFGGSVRCLKD